MKWITRCTSLFQILLNYDVQLFCSVRIVEVSDYFLNRVALLSCNVYTYIYTHTYTRTRTDRNGVPRRWRSATHTRSRAHTCLLVARRRSGSGQKVVGRATVMHPPRLTLGRERKHYTTYAMGKCGVLCSTLCERYTGYHGI